MRSYPGGYLAKVWSEGKIIHDEVYVLSLSEGPVYIDGKAEEGHKGWEVLINDKLTFLDALNHSIEKL